jgi:hypothetical protein
VVYGALPDDLVELCLDNNYLLELDCALLPKTLEVLQVRNVRTLTSIRNLDQLPNLCELNLGGCSGLTTLPVLPPKLHTVRLGHCIGLTELPPLARLPNLRILDINMTTRLHELPALPEGLTWLLAQFSALDEPPYLPESLCCLDLAHSMVVLLGLAPERRDREGIADYTERTRTWWNGCLAKERFDAIHEELMAAAWHPKRVEAWLSHGEEVLDNIMGC